MYEEEEETITHIICQCRKLAQKKRETRQSSEISTLGVMWKKIIYIMKQSGMRMNQKV